MKLLKIGAVIRCTKGLLGQMPFQADWSGNEDGLGILLETALPDSCGMCTSSKNPQVAAQDGQPTLCIPVPVDSPPWKNASKLVRFDGKAALHEGSTCKCLWGGSIGFVLPQGFVNTDK